MIDDYEREKQQRLEDLKNEIDNDQRIVRYHKIGTYIGTEKQKCCIVTNNPICLNEHSMVR